MTGRRCSTKMAGVMAATAVAAVMVGLNRYRLPKESSLRHLAKMDGITTWSAWRLGHPSRTPKKPSPPDPRPAR